jgi:hypothetical protein
VLRVRDETGLRLPLRRLPPLESRKVAGRGGGGGGGGGGRRERSEGYDLRGGSRADGDEEAPPPPTKFLRGRLLSGFASSVLRRRRRDARIRCEKKEREGNERQCMRGLETNEKTTNVQMFVAVQYDYCTFEGSCYCTCTRTRTRTCSPTMIATFEGTYVPSKVATEGTGGTLPSKVPLVRRYFRTFEGTFEGTFVRRYFRKYFRTFILSYFRTFEGTFGRIHCTEVLPYFRTVHVHAQ